MDGCVFCAIVAGIVEASIVREDGATVQESIERVERPIGHPRAGQESLGDVEVVPIAPAERSALDRLLQLYQYEFGAIEGGDVDGAGRYNYVDGEVIWRDPGWHRFFIKVGGRLAGFVFVVQHASFLEPGATTWFVDEFFVLRKYQRRGVGERAARWVFDRFPGHWEVSQTPHNAPATAFWRRVIGRYTGGRFREVALDGERWRGAVQTFRAPPVG